MTHLFVGPHPDAVALSCGGLVASLRDRGQSVALLTVFSGAGSLPELTPYQREALGFGDVAGAVDPREVMAQRRAEDEAYASLVGAAIEFLNLPDAVFRGYEGEVPLMGAPRSDDPAPVDALARAIAAVEPERVYFPLSVGGHVDHRQVHRAGLAMLAGPAAGVAAGVARVAPGRVLFYEDFPYVATVGFEHLGQLPPGALEGLPPDLTLAPEYVAVSDLLDRRIDGIRAYSSQIDRLFGGDAAMAEAVRAHCARVGRLGGMGPAERYWRTVSD